MTKIKMKDIPHWKAYNMQKNMAINRGIEWDLTFEQWKQWWGDDIVNRGKGPGKLVMGRIDTSEPYTWNNLNKVSHAENCIRSTKGVPTKKSRPCRTPLGEFISVAEAARAHGHMNSVTINRRLLFNQPGYEYLDV